MHNRGIAPIYLVVILVILVAGAVMLSGGNSDKASEPSEEAKAALEGVLAVNESNNSYSYEGDLSLRTEGGEIEDSSTGVVIQTPSIDLAASFSGAGELDLETFEERGVSSVIVHTLSFSQAGIEFAISEPLELRTIADEGTAYFYVNNLPEMAALFLGGLDVEDRWIEISEDDALDFAGADEEIINASEEFEAELVSKLMTELPNIDLFEATKQFSNERIGGVDTYHLEVVLNKDGLKRLVTLIFEDLPDLFGTLAIEEDDLGDPVAEINAEIDEIDWMQFPFELWVGVEDNNIYQMDLDLDIDEISDGEMSGEFALAMTVNSYGEEVELEIPEDATSFLEIMEEFQAQFAVPPAVE